jgi:5-methylcytosine-specific restriction endonuclease McrA
VTAAKHIEDLIKVRWEPSEDQILRDVWPSCTVPEILEALPGRTIRTCGRRASELGIRCESRKHLNKVISPVIMRENVPGKFCVGLCREWHPLEKFSKHPTCSGGRRNTCTTCEGRIAYANNPEQKIALVRAYQKRNPEKIREHGRNAYHKRRSQKKGGRGVSPEETKALFAAYGGLCAYCKKNKAASLDHVIPLSRGGEHCIENVVPACLDCNCSKHARTPEEWFAALARKEK